jgi:hypothetical protein
VYRLFTLLIVLSVAVQPLLQTLVVAHYRLNKEYIAEYLCINKSKPSMKCEGKCYLYKQLKKTDEGQNKAPKTLKQFNDFVLIAEEISSFDFYLNEWLLLVSSYVSCFFSSYLSDCFHPPRK